MSSTGLPSEQVGDGSVSDVDEGSSQPVLRLRGGAPEELDDDESFYEPDQIAHPVTGIGAQSGEVYIPQVQQATALATLMTPVQQAMTVSEAAAESLEEIPDDVLVATVGYEPEVEVTTVAVPQVYHWQLVGKTWMQHTDLVRKVETWWTDKAAHSVELVDGPILFLLIHLFGNFGVFGN